MCSPLARSAVSLLLFSALAMWASCSLFRSPSPLIRTYDSFDSPLRVAPPVRELSTIFTLSAVGRLDSLKKPDSQTLYGYVTNNREFFERVLHPVLSPHVAELSKQHPVQAINTLMLVSHEAYQAYFGHRFYRWGGDILDLDEPQEEGARHQYAYGLDCSGFASMPYEIAVLLGILDPGSEYAAFSSQGFARHARARDMPDLGGRLSNGNRYRVDTHDLLRLGREIFSIDSGATPSPGQVGLLQPGDIVGTPGHVGFIVEIEGEPYYVESGGWVLRKSRGNPYRALEALAIFASRGPLTVRRALPDYPIHAAK